MSMDFLCLELVSGTVIRLAWSWHCLHAGGTTAVQKHSLGNMYLVWPANCQQHQACHDDPNVRSEQEHML